MKVSDYWFSSKSLFFCSKLNFIPIKISMYDVLPNYLENNIAIVKIKMANS